MKAKIQCVTSGDCSFFHPVVFSISSVVLCIPEECSIRQMDHRVFNHLDHFQILAILNKAATHIGVHISVWT